MYTSLYIIHTPYIHLTHTSTHPTTPCIRPNTRLKNNLLNICALNNLLNSVDPITNKVTRAPGWLEKWTYVNRRAIILHPVYTLYTPMYTYVHPLFMYIHHIYNHIYTLHASKHPLNTLYGALKQPIKQVRTGFMPTALPLTCPSIALGRSWPNWFSSRRCLKGSKGACGTCTLRLSFGNPRARTFMEYVYGWEGVCVHGWEGVCVWEGVCMDG